MTVVSPDPVDLRVPGSPADTGGMESYARRQLALDQSWRPLLVAYSEAEEALAAERASSPEADAEQASSAEDETNVVEADVDDSDAEESETPERASRQPLWIPRIDSVEGTKDEHLPRIHGKLIAFGLLKFQLNSPVTGVEYRVTPLGRTMLQQAEADDAPHREAA